MTISTLVSRSKSTAGAKLLRFGDWTIQKNKKTARYFLSIKTTTVDLNKLNKKVFSYPSKNPERNLTKIHPVQKGRLRLNYDLTYLKSLFENATAAIIIQMNWRFIS